MIERYTIKFGPAVSQKELEKALNEATTPDDLKKLRKMKARIEFLGDLEDIQSISSHLKELSKPAEKR
jgi:hypothetical protein